MKSRSHRKGQIVTCTIERILPFGVFVRLDDGSKGYIRRRELSLSGDQKSMSEFKVADRIAAMIIEPESPGRTLELSHKATLPDPWLDLTQKHQVGNSVEGIVTRLTANGAYIEIVPGVQGFAPLGELAPWPVSAPSDLLWPGDHVKAVITHINSAERRIRVSLRRGLERTAFIQTVLDVVRQPKKGADADPDDLVDPTQVDSTQGPDSEPVRLKAPILIVEDTIDIRDPLAKWLGDQGCEIQLAESPRHALQLCQERTFALVLADLDMPDLDGASLIKELRARNISVPIAVMSTPDLIAHQLPALQSCDIAAAFPKPLDLGDVRELLAQIENGERPTLEMKSGAPEPPSEIQPFQELIKTTKAHSPIKERLRHSLEQLVKDTNASTGIIFHLDPTSMQVTLVEHVGDIPLQKDALYGLPESPVKDVIVEERLILENYVSRERAGQFRKLQELLPFESCIALPLHVAGRTEHALFLFQEAAGAFSPFRQRNAIAAGALLAAILENQALDQRVRALSGIFLSGQLAAGFGHEVNNKLGSLDIQFQNLRADIARFAREHEGVAGSPDFTTIQNAIEQAAETYTKLGRTVAEFRRLMETHDHREVDINQIVRQAEQLIQPVARRARVDVRSDLAEPLPAVMGSSLGLQQAFLNLMLNGGFDSVLTRLRPFVIAP